MLTAKLILERLNERGELLERREQQAHSFTRGLIDLLYAASIQCQFASPYPITNVDNVARNVDLQAPGNTSGRRFSGHLRIGAPAGQGFAQMPEWYYGAGDLYYAGTRASILGNDLGIIVGVGHAAAVSSANRRLEQRIGHGRRLADGAAVVFENYAAGEDSNFDIGTALIWAAQEFIPAVSHRLTSVWVKIYKAGAPGNLSVSIMAADSLAAATDYVPSQVPLVAGTILEAAIPGASPGALTQCIFAAPVDVYAGHRYYIVLNAPGAAGANHVYWRYDTAAATYLRAFDTKVTNAFTRRHTSVNSGVTWTTTNGGCFMFEEWGQSVGEFEYGGCELSNINFPAGIGEFTIRRYLENHSTAAITVWEVGITAAAMWHNVGGVDNPYADTFLIARDIVAGGQIVANGELLRVTYVPHIAV